MAVHPLPLSVIPAPEKVPVIFGAYPNITGNVGFGFGENTATGAFYKGSAQYIPRASTASNESPVWINASRSSSLYGASSTVQVNSFHVLMIIKT